MKKIKTPGICYALYAFAALAAVCGIMVLADNLTTLMNNLATYTFSALSFDQKLAYIELITDPVLNYGFQIVVLLAAAFACKKISARNANEDYTDEELEEETFGTVLTASELEEAKALVEGNMAEAAPAEEAPADAE